MGTRPGSWTIIVLGLILASSLAFVPEASPKETTFRDPVPDGEPDYHSEFKQYMDYPAMTTYLQRLAEKHSSIMSLWSLGNTYEGREIWAVKLSDNVRTTDDGEKDSEPNALIVGAHHGNEWISYEAALYLLTFLVENYGGDDANGSAASYLVDNREIFIVPMLNPDGTQYAHDVERGWRKNREPNYLLDNSPGNFIEPDAVPVSYGTDINRNYGWMWHEMGGSNIVLSRGASFRGPPDNKDDDGDAIIQIDIRNGILPGPDEGVDEDPWDGIDNDGDGEVDEDPAGGFSSAETMAMRKLGDTYHFPVAITYHSYSELILWPWGYVEEPTKDGPHMEQLGTRMAEMNGYRPMQGYELYRVTGEFNDWFYAQYGTYGYTFEIGRRHSIPPEEILNHTMRNLDPSLYLIYSAENPFVAYLKTDENSTRVWRSGDRIRVEFQLEDQGYPVPFVEGSFNINYRWEGGQWHSRPLTLDGNGNFSSSLPVEVDEGKLELYIEMTDDRGNVITEPAYAPYRLIVFEMKLDSIFSLYFGFDTFVVMLFTLGVAWGGFTLGVTRSLMIQKKREEMNG